MFSSIDIRIFILVIFFIVRWMCVPQFSLVTDKSVYKQSLVTVRYETENYSPHITVSVMSGLTLRQVIYGFGCIPLCIIGLLGNIFSLLVLYPSKYNQTKVQPHYSLIGTRQSLSLLYISLSQGLFYGYLGVLSVTDIIWLFLNLTFRLI